MDKLKAVVKQKTFWAGLVSIVTGLGMVFNDDVSNGVQLILTGVTAVFLRQGIAKSNQ